MPRAARRKHEKEKELVETAKKMRKLTSFFDTAPTKEIVEPDWSFVRRDTAFKIRFKLQGEIGN